MTHPDNLPDDLVKLATLTDVEMRRLPHLAAPGREHEEILAEAAKKAMLIGIAEGERREHERREHDRLRPLLQQCLLALEQVRLGESGYALYDAIQQLCADISREMAS